MPQSVGVAAAPRARWASARGFELGLLLGQRAWGAGGRASVLAAAPVPPESGALCPFLSSFFCCCCCCLWTGDRRRDAAELGGARGFADVSAEWAADCAQQVERMLPGGVAVLGLYAATPASVSAGDAFGKALFYLRELQVEDEALYFVHAASGAPPVAKSFENVGNAAKVDNALRVNSAKLTS